MNGELFTFIARLFWLPIIYPVTLLGLVFPGFQPIAEQILAAIAQITSV
ncbi:MAG: hypothetical protein GXZ02_01610 [Clostridiales bacterium]|nr:hypothetical protein [Clostridiales bacterium]